MLSFYDSYSVIKVYLFIYLFLKLTTDCASDDQIPNNILFKVFNLLVITNNTTTGFVWKCLTNEMRPVLYYFFLSTILVHIPVLQSHLNSNS